MTNNVNKTQENCDLIWKHTHKDFKGTLGGEKSIMYPAPHSCIGTVMGMPDDLFDEKLRWAKHSEVVCKCDVELSKIMNVHGLLEAYNSTRQWRESLKDIMTFVSFCVDEEKQMLIKNDILASDVVFPGSYKF